MIPQTLASLQHNPLHFDFIIRDAARVVDVGAGNADQQYDLLSMNIPPALCSDCLTQFLSSPHNALTLRQSGCGAGESGAVNKYNQVYAPCSYKKW